MYLNRYFILFSRYWLRIFLCGIISTTSSANPIKQKEVQFAQYQKIDWTQISLEETRKHLPSRFYGNDISLMPVQFLYFLPKPHLIELKKIWKTYKKPAAKVIVLANGVYRLKNLEKLISDSKILKKQDNTTYISYRPIYVSPSATLVIKEEELRLSINAGAFILAHGNVFISDSILTSWDEAASDFGKREKLTAEKLSLTGIQMPRPYVLFGNGSVFYAINSTFRGLGYNGTEGTYGISVIEKSSRKVSQKGLERFVVNKGRSKSRLIGNTFEFNYIPFFSKNAADVMIVGNLFTDNVISNIENKHNSGKLIITRNISQRTNNGHGIKVSNSAKSSVIAENIVVNNANTGILVEKKSTTNLIYKNLIVDNLGEGISIFESDNNKVSDNTVSRNGGNGIFVRNSCNITIQSNYLFRNAKSGAQISVSDNKKSDNPSFSMNRHYYATNVVLNENIFDNNLTSAVSSKNQPGIDLVNNSFVNSGSLYFYGDLESHTREILSNKNKEVFHLKGKNQCR